jgi:proteic killer suppression protein
MYICNEFSNKNKKLKKRFTDDIELMKAFGTRAKKIKLRRVQLKAADNLKAISSLRVLRLHPYSGARLGEWSIDIQENWRIIFKPDHDPIPLKEDGGVNLELITAIKIVSVEDPH